ncbi:MAG: CPBP family intramembrane metalloprotease [Treponema sp.]|nr:CPBP family intramembrane metalloprotease [Treponema sp.]
MKKKYIIIEFFAIMIFLIIPPLLVNPGTTATIANNGKFSPYIFLRLIIAIFLYYQHIYVIKKTHGSQKESFRNLILFCSWSALCFGLLMVTQALMQALAMVLPVDYQETSIEFNLSRFDYIFVLFNLLAAAFYEEVIYREFLPETLLLLSGDRKIFVVLIECACVIIFSMSHRYLGMMAVLNALLGGIILRLCRKKSLSIWAGTLAHFLYNAVLLLFAILQKK